MFGLPILRKYSQEFTPGVGDPLEPNKPVRLASPLAEMSGNHYTMGVSISWIHVVAWGSNFPSDGVLGFSGTYKKPTLSNINRATDPVLGVPEKSKIKKLSSIGQVSLVLSDMGYLYGTGVDIGGITGNGHTTQFKLIDSDVVYYDLSSYNTNNNTWWSANEASLFLIKKNGRLYGRGKDYGAFGVSGNKTTTTYLNIDNVKKVFATQPENKGKTFALKNDGTVWATGWNTDGVLGIGEKLNEKASTWYQVIKSDNTPLNNVVDIITSNFIVKGGANDGDMVWNGVNGNSHQSTVFLTKDGDVYSTGNNLYGQLGLGQSITYKVNYATKITTLSNIDKICGCAGGISFMAVDNNNTVYTWGNNHWGQLGTNDQVDRNAPYQHTKFLANGEIITRINGGGLHNTVNGAFIMCTNYGNVYSSGYNYTRALGYDDADLIKTIRKHPYFGPDATKKIKKFNDTPATSNLRALAYDLDLCGYGTEMAQKVITPDGVLFMCGYNQNVGGTKNFNQDEDEKVLVPSVFIMPS